MYLNPKFTSPLKMNEDRVWLKLKELKTYCKKAGFNVKKQQVGQYYYESLLTVEDTVGTKKMKQMQPWEFLVFICRVTHQHF